MAFQFDPSSGYGVGDNPAQRQQRQASLTLQEQVRTWPAGFGNVQDQVRAQLAYFKQRRNLGRVTEGEVSRLSERVRDEYEDIAQRLIDSGDTIGWNMRARTQIQARIRPMAREFVDAIQLIALGGGDRETATMVGIRDIDTVRPTQQTEETPGVNLARQVWERYGGTLEAAYETPVSVEVETETGVEVLPPIAPCDLDAIGFDLKSWAWFVMLNRMGAVG